MKFGAIFKDKESLADSLKKDHLEIQEPSWELAGERGMSEKSTANLKFLKMKSKRNHQRSEANLEEIKSLPGRQTIFLEEEINEMAKKRREIL